MRLKNLNLQKELYFVLLFLWANFGIIYNFAYLINLNLPIGYVGFMAAACALMFCSLLFKKSISSKYSIDIIILLVLALIYLVLSFLKEYIYVGYLDSSESTEALTKFAFPLVAYAIVRYVHNFHSHKENKLIISLLGFSSLAIGLAQWYFVSPLILTGGKDSGWEAIIWKFGQDFGGYAVRAFGFFESPVPYGLFASIFLMAYLSKRRLYYAPIILFAALCIYATLNRTVWIVAVFSLIFFSATRYLLKSSKISRKGIVLLCSAILSLPFISLFSTVAFYRLATITENNFTKNIIVRLQDNPETLDRASRRVTGILIGSDIRQIRESRVNRPDDLSYTPIDNDILFSYVKFGLIGVAIYIILGYIMLYRNLIDYYTTGKKIYLITYSYVAACIVGGVSNVILISYINICALGFLFMVFMIGSNGRSNSLTARLHKDREAK